MSSLEWLFIVALILYTGVIWTHRLTGRLKTWMVLVFGLGLLADLSGTIFLCAFAARHWNFTLHTVSGLLSLLIMALHFTWAVSALARRDRAEAHFHRFSIYAWGLWLISFISGLPLWG